VLAEFHCSDQLLANVVIFLGIVDEEHSRGLSVCLQDGFGVVTQFGRCFPNSIAISQSFLIHSSSTSSPYSTMTTSSQSPLSEIAKRLGSTECNLRQKLRKRLPIIADFDLSAVFESSSMASSCPGSSITVTCTFRVLHDILISFLNHSFPGKVTFSEKQ